MKPIAHVHWVEGYGENHKVFYDMLTLNRFVKDLNQRNLVSYTLLTSIEAEVPVRTPERHVRGA
jgi:hypothetical protein